METPDEIELTDVQAEELLKKLSRHYKQPVMPMKKYCEALDSWMQAVREGCLDELKKNKESDQPDAPLFKHGCEYYEHLRRIRTDIAKSGLLYRLLFMGEKLRTVKCPKHQGKMDTPTWVGFPGVECICQGTGWLPNEEEIPKTSE